MDDPAARRARLKAIREAANVSGDANQADGGATGVDEANKNKDAPPSQEPVLKFRNYAVRDEKIEHEKVGNLLVNGAIYLDLRSIEYFKI